MARRRFHLILIKPSHYHNDGYVIRWWRGLVPSNSLAAMHGIALDCADRRVLGPDVDIEIDIIDETNTRVNTPKLLRRLRRVGNFGMIGLVGVQTNQYPRALDIARPFRAAGIPVVIGGFHVSGCLSMLDGKAVQLDRARELGITIFAGEAEGRLEALIKGAADGTLLPQYDFTKDLVDMAGNPSPFLPYKYVKRTAGTNSSFDSGRGCPYQCSFCTIINVQGRKSRSRTPDDVERVVRENYARWRLPLLPHRRQFRPQPGVGADPRPADQASRGRQDSDRPDDPGRYALPQNSELHGEVQTRGRDARLHRA